MYSYEQFVGGQHRISEKYDYVKNADLKLGGQYKMEEYIRAVEKIIDNYHKQSPVFSLNRKTALYNALSVFEDTCRLAGTTDLALTGDGLEHSFLIREQLDALNVLINWIFQECPHTSADTLDMNIIPDRYTDTANLLQFQAKPYSPICSAYISYSRKHLSASVNEAQKKITFLDNPENRSIVISDMVESIVRDQSMDLTFAPVHDLSLANRKLISSIKFKDGCISYSTDEEIWGPFQRMMERQWINTSELPEEWRFDTFSIKDFKQFWVAIATLCIIHMVACLKSGIQGADVEEAVLVKSSTEFAKIISDRTEISAGSIFAILKLLTYNSQLKNNDIVYQPFVEIDDEKLALAPHLILASRPERNLISLIHKLRDKSYFSLTNLREGIMQDELDTVTQELPNILVAKNKSLPNTLPDVDYAIWDKESNSILICELKWFIEADSTPEVFARIQDLEHGCSQVSNILTYVKNHYSEFCDRVFGITSLDNLPEVIGCVVSKTGIRVDNSIIPVISLQALMNLLKHSSVIETIEAIKGKTYLLSAPKYLNYGLIALSYAGYTFEIPALIKDQPVIQGTYKRIGHKIGRNDPCSCGSGKKYKKCCGR